MIIQLHNKWMLNFAKHNYADLKLGNIFKKSTEGEIFVDVIWQYLWGIFENGCRLYRDWYLVINSAEKYLVTDELARPQNLECSYSDSVVVM